MSTLGRGAPDYTVNVRGSRYVAEPRAPFEPLRNTSLSQLWLDINSEVAGPSVEFGRGEFEADTTLEYTGIGTIIRGQGQYATRIKLADNVNNDLLRLDPGLYLQGCELSHIGLDANRDNNNAGRAFEWDVTVAATPAGWYPRMLYIHHASIQYADDAGLFIKTSTGAAPSVDILDVQVKNNDGEQDGGAGTAYQTHLNRVFDSHVEVFSTPSMCMVGSSSSNSLYDLYIGGGAPDIFKMGNTDSAYPCTSNRFVNCIFDNSTTSAFLMSGYNRRNLFTNCSFEDPNQTITMGTYPALDMQGTALYNNFFGCFFGHMGIVTTNRWEYAVEETENADYNKYINCIAGHFALGGGNAEHFTQDEYLIAANSQAVNCYKDDGNVWATS